MSATADPADKSNPATRLGFEEGQIVQELGYDDDTDQDLREGIEEITGTTRTTTTSRTPSCCGTATTTGTSPTPSSTPWNTWPRAV